MPYPYFTSFCTFVQWTRLFLTACKAGGGLNSRVQRGLLLGLRLGIGRARS